MTFPTFSLASRRPFAIVWLSMIVLPLALFTATITRLHKRHLATLVADWSTRGEHAYRVGLAGEAVDDFRSALMYAREDRTLRLKLARALVAVGRGAEARGYLLTLWEDEPGDGPVNLELGRIAARERNVADASRYYHTAIEGAWDSDAERRRREARLELVDYLLTAGDTARARPELVALSADMPEDLPLRKTIAALFARAGQSSSALAAYQQVLAVSPNDTEALTGAGEAAFRSAEYAAAARYLGRALGHGELSKDVARDAADARLVLDVDPSQPRLGMTRRAERVRRAFEAAAARLTACLPLRPDSSDLPPLSAKLEEIAPRAGLRSLERNPDDVEGVLAVVFDVEASTARLCGEPTGIDRALYLLANGRKAEQ